MRKSLTKSLPILVVDDEHDVLESFKLILASSGLTSVITCQDSRQTLDILAQNSDIGVVLLDLMMPNTNGQELLEQIIDSHPDISVIVITAVDDLQTAVSCMKTGAFDYLVKPVEKHRMISSIYRAGAILELERENMELKKSFLTETLNNPDTFAPIVGRSQNIIKLFQYIEAITKSTEPVLITGETGTGKELFARAIHESSSVNGPYVTVNIAGLDDSTFSDTLFGHSKGAFTGADNPRAGLIQKAEGGTLFLDEIGDLSHLSQVKLLRLLQEQEYYPLGSDFPKRSNARILVATHCDLGTADKGGKFRQDLFYRLKTHHICIPPLSERKGDLPLLVETFLQRAADKLGVRPPTINNNLLAVLKNYDFPGNVRELETLLFDAVSRNNTAKLTASFIHEQLHQSISKNTFSEEKEDSQGGLYDHMSVLPTLKEATHELIKQAMQRANGNQSLAARFLGLSQPALNRRLSREKNKENMT